MKILVACEESQIVTNELRKLGHLAFSCDILPTSGKNPSWHIQEKAELVINENWDMIIAFPPCTYIANSSAIRMYNSPGVINIERLEKARKAKEFFMLFYNSNCPKIAIENPVPLHIVNLPKKDQIIQPFQFGDPYSKKTYLWLKGLPKLKSTKYISNYKSYIEVIKKSKRSKTFPGIAKAMADQFTDPKRIPIKKFHQLSLNF